MTQPWATTLYPSFFICEMGLCDSYVLQCELTWVTHAELMALSKHSVSVTH